MRKKKRSDLPRQHRQHRLEPSLVVKVHAAGKIGVQVSSLDDPMAPPGQFPDGVLLAQPALQPDLYSAVVTTASDMQVDGEVIVLVVNVDPSYRVKRDDLWVVAVRKV
jgi:hypothetical protein